MKFIFVQVNIKFANTAGEGEYTYSNLELCAHNKTYYDTVYPTSVIQANANAISTANTSITKYDCFAKTAARMQRIKNFRYFGTNIFRNTKFPQFNKSLHSSTHSDSYYSRSHIRSHSTIDILHLKVIIGHKDTNRKS